jgi:hypothetical protein
MREAPQVEEAFAFADRLKAAMMVTETVAG